MKKKAYIKELLTACSAKDQRILDLENTLRNAIETCQAGRMSPMDLDGFYLTRVNKSRVHIWFVINVLSPDLFLSRVRL